MHDSAPAVSAPAIKSLRVLLRLPKVTARSAMPSLAMVFELWRHARQHRQLLTGIGGGLLVGGILCLVDAWSRSKPQLPSAAEAPAGAVQLEVQRPNASPPIGTGSIAQATPATGSVPSTPAAPTAVARLEGTLHTAEAAHGTARSSLH